MSCLRRMNWLQALPLAVLLMSLHGFVGGQDFDRWSVLDGIASSSQVYTPGSDDTPPSTDSLPSSPTNQPDSPPSPPPSPQTSHSTSDSSMKRSADFKSTGSKKSSCEAVACFTDSSCENAGCGGHMCMKCSTCTGTEASGVCLPKGKDRECPAITCSDDAPKPLFVPIPSPYPPPPPPPPPSPTPPPPPPPPPSPVAPPPPERVFEIAPPQVSIPEAVHTDSANVIQIPWGQVAVGQQQTQHVETSNGQTTYIPVVFAVPTAQAGGHGQHVFPNHQPHPPPSQPPPESTPAPAPARAPGFQLFNGNLLEQLGIVGRR